MSFIGSKDGAVYAPGYFLAHEECTRETHQFSQTGATTTAEGGKYVKGGTIYPSNDGDAIGVVYEDVDVTNGDMPGSVVTSGFVFKERLRVVPTTAAGSAMTGITFVEEPTVTRPEFE